MLKYRRIIAGILAVNLLAGSILLDYTEVNANNVNTSLNMISADNSDEVSHADAESVSSSEKTDAENKADEKNTTLDANEKDENTASSNSDAGLTNETQEEETTKQEPSSEIAAEDASQQATEAETEAEAQEISDTISLSDLNFFTNNTATIKSPQELILLSHCAQKEIQNITININATGNLDLSTKIETGTDLSEYLNKAANASQDYTYLGLGSTDIPFKGTITGQTPAIKTNTTLFRGISSNAKIEKNFSVEWQGDGTKPMFAEMYVLENDGTKSDGTIPITFTSGNGSLLGTVRQASEGTNACLTIGNVVTYKDNKAQAVSSTSNNNIGLICNTLESGTIKLDGYVFPTETTINTDSGAAGGLIGKMEGGILDLTSIGGANISKLTVNSSSGGAGSIVGEMSETAQIQVNQNITITSPTIKGKYAGGFAGKVVNSTLSGDKKITINSPALSSEKNEDSAVGGWIGDYIVRGNNHEDKILPAQIDVAEPKVTMNGGVATNGGNAGGYFGLLELQGDINYQISGTKQEKKNITSEYTAGNGGIYGTVIGKVVTSNDNKRASLNINHVKSNSTIKGNSYYQGGLVGEIGENVYLQVSDAEITVSKTTAKEDACGFGGVVGHLSSNSILSIVDSVKVTNSGTISGGGGLVGVASSGSILEISGTTDLSNVTYKESEYVGQLVGMQDCALIFARGDGNGNDNGWKYIRSKNDSKINDIGNYGEVIRLKAKTTTSDAQGGLDSELLSINGEHVIQYKNPNFSLSNTEITINSKEDLALLSIAWNSRGVFSADSNLKADNWTTLQNKNINFTANINLQNTGIIGISRDISDNAYTGNINGNTNTVTLSIGETYGYKGESIVTDETEGCGKIYSSGSKHTDIGLFSRMGGNVSNLTITGSIHTGVSNGDMWIGSIAARQETNETVISNVQVTTAIAFDAKGDSKISRLGGLFGSAGKVKLNGNTCIQSNITLRNAGSGKLTYVGSVAGYMSAGTLECNGVTIGGTIATDASMYAYVGGLLGFMPPDGSDKDTSTQVNIKALTFDGFSITASNAQTACGGLLGGVWARSAVTFASDNTATTSCLTVNNATINAPKASVGGLAYKASGLWEIRSKGIDIQKLQIHCGEDLGLLVCHGEKSTVKFNKNEKNDKEDGALYLRTTADWNDSYKLAANLDLQCGGKAVFDEFVAYTAASKDNIANNDENGIVSIATKDRNGVKEENTTCKTYQNRTNLGKSHKINANSRYYYDLDEYTGTASTNTNNTGKIDTPEELVLWSCAVYANSNIKKYFYTFNNQEIADIKDNISNPTISGTLNMDKYSYYPIHLKTGVGITDATITFYNEQIEKAEKNNKSTQATTQSQHYMMHCGLFLDHSVNETATSITLSNVKFAGSIGKVNSNASGVLFSGTVQGSESNGRQNTAKMNLNNIVLSGLKITAYKDSSYAPLLINQIGSYTKTEIKSLSTSDYTEGTAVASSLIGNAGSENGHQINMGFSEIKLPDTKGIFTHATLLESYKYAANDTSVATYNFYKSGDWEGNTYKHEVTYGKEISDSLEYNGLQKWYYDIATYNKDEGLVKTGDNQTDFSTWLPYVYVSYNKNNHSHEIKVNQRVFDITEGCGTYGDPYVITAAGEMEIISEYMRTNLPRTDWKITITDDQNRYCTKHSTDDITFRYNGEQWVQVEKEITEGTENWVDVKNGYTRSNSFMQRYIANAYYDLQGTNGQITLNDFKGFGTTDNPFRGVLVSTNTNGVELSLTGANTGNGLIAYSYGSVVKNLTIRYKREKKTLVYQKSSSVFYPTSCFGGAIGCILGGDNIIDGVNVTLETGWLTLSGANKHLLQVGGYVGSVCGGGVLFRNMQDAPGLTDAMISGGSVAEAAMSSLYVNPYVGRVLDGYAFADTMEESLNNTDKNYQIRNLNSSGTNDTKHITASGKSIGIKDAEGLLILSAIVNSGAASSGSSNAYRNITEGALQQGYAFGNGEYGKVRNAAYDSIGANTKPDDFDTAVKDDRTAPSDSNTPVLITKYAEKNLFNMAVLNATTGGATLTFPNNGKLDMSVYKSSYQGISARYVSNAVTSNTETKAAGIVPLIQGVSGNGTNIIFDMNVKEYADDDFHAASVGGVFNLFAPVSGTCNVTNLTFTGKTGTDSNTGVQLQYYTSDGVVTAQASNLEEKLDKGQKLGSYVGVGSFVGSTAGTLTPKWYSVNVNFDSVKFENMTIQSPAVAGGLIGNIARIYTPTSDIGILLQPYGNEQTVYPYNTFTNCSFRNLTVRGQEKAGGFCGYIDGKVANQNNLNVTTQNFIVGQDSIISAALKDSCSGGLFGYARRGVAINYGSGTYTAAIWENVNVEAGQYSGGIIGQVYTDSSSPKYNIKNVKVSGKTGTNSLIKGTSSDEIYTGGLIGKISFDSGVTFDISDCEVQNVQINEVGKVSGEKFRTGGLVGSADGNGKLNVQNCSVKESDLYGSLAGGIAGALHTPTTITECTVSGLSDDKNIIKGQKSAAGIVGEIVCGGKIGIHKSTVSNTSITAIDDWGAGGLVGDIDWNVVPNLYFYDSQVNGCTIIGKRAGGFAGNIRGYLNGSNLLLKNTTIEASTANNGGLLIGLTGNRNLKPMTIAGVSIQNTTAKENNSNISKLYGTLNETQNTAVKKQSYFSFADYNGTASNNTMQSLLDANPVFPYVVTSPTSQLSVYDATNANVGKALYGDSAAWTTDADGKFTLNAQTIYQDAKNTQSSTAEGKYTYQETGVEQFQFTKNISTYNKENQTKKVSNDFPVLVVSDNVSQTITDYLDIITNGGYTRANNISGDSDIHVDASVKTYTDTDGKFVLATNANPALEVKKNASGRISEFAATTEFDNTKSRFTLLTVTFKEKDESNAEHKYNVQVPIIVRRMLEIGFTATLSSGTNYRATNYDLIEDSAHLLESTGNAFTAYLTYTYNSDDKGLYSEYGWNSYINAGGNVAEALNKSIDFQGSSLPARTQLSLIDCQDNSKVYYYTTDSNTGNTISLKDFKDSSENAFQAVSIGELMGVTATQDNNGTFIKVDAEGVPDGVTKEDGKTYTAPTVKIKTENGYEYYRKIEIGEPGTRYAVTVDESKLKDGVGPISTVHENYYLVITVADITSGTDLNGSVQTKITSNGIPLHLNYRTRKGKVEDTHSSTASTYQISHGYKQTLTEAVTGAIKKVTATDSSMAVDVIDKITIPSGQAFNNKDELYQKFSGSLIKTLKQENSQSTSAEVFPNGTTGTAAFYVYVMDGTKKKYYTYTNGNWTEAGSTETKALEYEWTAINGLMDLPLSTSGTIDSSVNLQQIRDIVKDKQKEFYVEVKMNAKLPTNGLDVIPESQLDNAVPTNYTKLTYTSQLATTRKSLSYSTARALLPNTTISYYRDEAAGVQLTYEADEIGQLGINLLDLQNSYLDAAKENTIIDTTARYDMSTIKDLSSILASSSGIQFSIQLQNKNTTQDTENYANALELEDYIKVSVKSENAGTVQLTNDNKAYTWTVPKSSYWDAGNKIMKASSIFDGDIMTQAIQLKVNIKNVDQLQHLYSNYRVVLSVGIIDQNGNVVGNTTAADNIIYTMARVKPEFQDKQNTR